MVAVRPSVVTLQAGFPLLKSIQQVVKVPKVQTSGLKNLPPILFMTGRNMISTPVVRILVCMAQSLFSSVAYLVLLLDPLDPPPSLTFPSRADLLSFCQEWAKHHLYAVIIANSHGQKNLYLACERFGQHNVQLGQERRSGSRKCGCVFKAKGTNRTPKGASQAIWQLDVLNPSHNHEPARDASGCLGHKKLNASQVEEVKKLAKSKVKPNLILNQLRSGDGSTLATTRTVYNTKAKIRKQALDGREPMEAFLQSIQQSDWVHETFVEPATGEFGPLFAHS